MNKRKFLPIFVLLALCISVGAAKWYDEERGNDKAHISVARQISALEGVDSAAVISRDGRVLAGIILMPDADEGYIGGWAEEMLKTTFPKAKEIRVFMGDKNARDVVELSFCMDSSVEEDMLIKRFDFLLKKDI